MYKNDRGAGGGGSKNHILGRTLISNCSNLSRFESDEENPFIGQSSNLCLTSSFRIVHDGLGGDRGEDPTPASNIFLKQFYPQHVTKPTNVWDWPEMNKSLMTENPTLSI